MSPLGRFPDPAPALRRIETPRLVLQPVPMPAAQALLAGRPVPGLIAGPGWPDSDTLDALALQAAGSGDDAGWFLTLRDGGAGIGHCGWRGGPDARGDVEIGYSVAGPWRERGLGGEAVQGLVAWCWAQPGVRRLLAEVLATNTSSRRLLGAAGFAAQGPHAGYLQYAHPVAPRGPSRRSAPPVGEGT